MKYPILPSGAEASGQIWTGDSVRRLLPWQPSTWPPADPDPLSFWVDFEFIVEESILTEIENVITDAQKANGSLKHRGYVIALALLCAVDTLASYAYEDVEASECKCCHRKDKIRPRFKKYIENFFPEDYKPHAEALYALYRNSIVHSWHLFKAGLLPEEERIQVIDGVVCFGLKHLFWALEESFKNFKKQFENDTNVQRSVMHRYSDLRSSARP